MKNAERGFTLIEVLIALVIFAIVAIGALAALGSTAASGFLEAFPTSFTTVRTARDYTAAATYLESLDDFIANKGKTAATPGTYCIENVSGACGAVLDLPSGLSGYPTPNQVSSPSQLNWTKLDVVIQQWGWDTATEAYSSSTSSTDYIVYVTSTLTWSFKERTRSLTVSRFFSCSAASAGCP